MLSPRIKAMLAALLRVLFALFFIAGGAFHFINPAYYERMMPPYLPAPGLLIALSGVAELVLGGLLLAVKAARRWAGWGLVALLIAVFPANVQMALHPELFPEYSPVLMTWVRLPLQVFLLLWAYAYARRPVSVDQGRSPA